MKKRICFIVDSIFSIGGVQRVTAVIAKELAKEYDVTIMTFDKPNQKDTSLYELEEADICYQFVEYPKIGKMKKQVCKAYSGIYIKAHLKSLWASNLYAHSSFPHELRSVLVKALEEGRYNVVVGVHAPLAARLATLRPQLPNVKMIGWIHNSFEALFGTSSHYIGAERKRHYAYQYRKLDQLVVLCNYDAKAFTNYDHQLKPTVIYNPLTLKPDAPSTGKAKRFLTVGRFTPQHKGIDLLIKAFAIFAKSNTDWQLDIVGEGQEEALYQQLIAKHQLESRVLIHPFTKHIQQHYSNASVYVLSSRWEGMPLVLVEAMSHGLPIISSDLPVSKEIMGSSGLYFKNGDIQSLVQQLDAATQMNWPKKSEEAIAIAKKFSTDAIAKEWQQLIEATTQRSL